MRHPIRSARDRRNTADYIGARFCDKGRASTGCPCGVVPFIRQFIEVCLWPLRQRREPSLRERNLEKRTAKDPRRGSLTTRLSARSKNARHATVSVRRLTAARFLANAPDPYMHLVRILCRILGSLLQLKFSQEVDAIRMFSLF
ncbi:hypothetical protein MRX96_027822 [Rhipicephalus microplus]